MKFKALPIVLSALTTLSMATSALADTKGNPDYEYDNAHKRLTSIATTPIKTAGFLCALPIGSAINVARREVRRTDEYLNDVASEYQHDGLTPTILFSPPGQLMRGIGTVGEGIFFASWAALDNFDKPFSPAQFSMEDLDHFD